LTACEAIFFSPGRRKKRIIVDLVTGAAGHVSAELGS